MVGGLKKVCSGISNKVKNLFLNRFRELSSELDASQISLTCLELSR